LAPWRLAYLMFAGEQTSLSSLDDIKPSSQPYRVTVRLRFRELSLSSVPETLKRKACSVPQPFGPLTDRPGLAIGAVGSHHRGRWLPVELQWESET
jgi:hypothetical protein